MNRNPNLAARTPENLGHLRKKVSKEKLKDFFLDLENFLLKEYGIVASEFFTEANGDRVFNLDESGFALCAKSKLKVITEKGTKSVYNVTAEGKEQITVLVCASANGNFEKPMVIFPGERSAIHFKSVDDAQRAGGYQQSHFLDGSPISLS